MTVTPETAGSGTGLARMLALLPVKPDSCEEPSNCPGLISVGGTEFSPVPKFETANSHSSPGSKIPLGVMLSCSRFAFAPTASI